MRRSAMAMAMLLAFWSAGSTARAGIYTDDLSKCLVKFANPSDQTDLIGWIFVAMSVHPAVQHYSNITEPQRVAADKQAGALFQRLLTADCRKETVSALKYEGRGSIEAAFGFLGQVAMRNLTSDPKVAESMGGLGKYIDNSKFEALFAEAGLADGAGAKPK